MQIQTKQITSKVTINIFGLVSISGDNFKNFKTLGLSEEGGNVPDPKSIMFDYFSMDFPHRIR